MKRTGINICLLILGFVLACTAQGQSSWKLTQEKDGIRVYQSDLPGTSFKRVKVECTLEGTYDKLVSILCNVDTHKNWVYSNKTSYLLKRISPTEFYYYTETAMPWPVQNRDAVMHVKVHRDSLNRFVTITETARPNFIPPKNGKVRVPRSVVGWTATMPRPNTLRIVYLFEADPGGELPAWLVNSFADKGPLESFKKLAAMLKKA